MIRSVVSRNSNKICPETQVDEHPWGETHIYNKGTSWFKTVKKKVWGREVNFVSVYSLVMIEGGMLNIGYTDKWLAS